MDFDLKKEVPLSSILLFCMFLEFHVSLPFRALMCRA